MCVWGVRLGGGVACVCVSIDDKAPDIEVALYLHPHLTHLLPPSFPYPSVLSLLLPPPRQRKEGMGQFYGAQLRFFKQLCTAGKVGQWACAHTETPASRPAQNALRATQMRCGRMRTGTRLLHPTH